MLNFKFKKFNISITFHSNLKFKINNLQFLFHAKFYKNYYFHI
jgi:hypothetical protein